MFLHQPVQRRLLVQSHKHGELHPCLAAQYPAIALSVASPATAALHDAGTVSSISAHYIIPNIKPPRSA